ALLSTAPYPFTMQIEGPNAALPASSVCGGYLPLRQVLFVAWIVLLPVVFASSLSLGFEDARAIALCSFAIVGWSAQPGRTPIEYTSLAFLALVTITGAMDWADAWRGMCQEGIWLIFCGMAMSLALTETRISQRIAQVLCLKKPTWPWLVLRLNMVGGLLALCVPSQVVRCQLVVPIARSIIGQLHLEPLSRRASAVMIALVISTNHCGAAVLTGGLPNIIAVSGLQHCDIEITWGFWFVRMAPVFWAVSILGNTAVVLVFSRNERGELYPSCPEDEAEDAAEAVHLIGTERCILWVFALCLVMWSTDVLHHVHPTTISLVAVLVLFCPVTNLIAFEKLKQVNFPVIIYTASLETLAPLLNAAPHAGPALSHAADTAVSVAPAGVLRLTMLFLAGMPLMLCNVAVPVALLVPELCPGRGLAGAGIEPRLGAMIVAAMPSCTLLPYQNAPFLIALSISRDIVKERHFVACLLGNALIGYLAVFPLLLAWWSLLGLNP
ncbi:unnamed protein product, partial [Durusdinium trenchii]